jgi:hypothetical protein
MSAEAFIAFYGVRIDVEDARVEALETRNDPTLEAARRAGLKHYWGQFGDMPVKYVLFVGDKLAVLGAENERAAVIDRDALIHRMAVVDEKLQQAGLGGPARLYLEWEPDY